MVHKREQPIGWSHNSNCLLLKGAYWCKLIFHGVGTGLLLVSFLHLSHRAESTFRFLSFQVGISHLSLASQVVSVV